uniref:Uncharacterized protein n=1 Tax=Romanomermis culicivorax TaxID=13658 RepID=A0A915K6T0_ROMCU
MRQKVRADDALIITIVLEDNALDHMFSKGGLHAALRPHDDMDDVHEINYQLLDTVRFYIDILYHPNN